MATCPDSKECKIRMDPMSHRVIEKRRRDRMNNCLADLSRLIPSNYLKKGRGRIEKTEIIEMAIKHLKQLQAHKCPTMDMMGRIGRGGVGGGGGGGPGSGSGLLPMPMMTLKEDVETPMDSADQREQYRLGYQECVSETMHFLVELEGLYPGDSLCIRLMNHLQKHCGRMVNGDHEDHHQLRADDGFASSRTTTTTTVGPGLVTSHRTETSRSVSPPSVSRPLSPCRGPQSEDESSHYERKTMADADNIGHIKIETKDTSSTCPAISNGHRSSTEDDEDDGDDEDEGPRGSQLREILQNPAMLLMNRSCPSVNGSRPVSTTSSSGSSSIRSDEVYKFKRNIKERFKADSVAAAMDNGHDHGHQRVHHGEEHQSEALKKRTYQDIAPTLPVAQDIGHRLHRPASIPIFALHPTGGYYVPMSLDASLVWPHMTVLHHQRGHADEALLHHVAIAVYFQNGGASVRIPPTPVPVPQEWMAHPHVHIDNQQQHQQHVPMETAATAPVT